MKNKGIKQIISTVLVAVLLTSLLPVQAIEEPAGRFVLVAEGLGQLVIVPQYVSYEAGANVGEALASSDHTFDGLQAGLVHTINGVTDGYSRSDQDGSYELTKPAAEVTHYRFSSSPAQPSRELQALMTAMADYLLEDPDVQAAAKNAYDTACSRFVGISDDEAAKLCRDLQEAIEAYKVSLAVSGTVIFKNGEKVYSQMNFAGVEIQLKNAYGKSYKDDDGDGSVTVPQGEYQFTISLNGNHIQGAVTVGMTPETVSAAMPTDDWLVKESFAVSEGYDDDFEAGKFSADAEDWNGRILIVPVLDTFSGTIYTYAEYTRNFTVVPAFLAFYQDSTGTQREGVELAFESQMIGPDRVLARGSEGNTVIYRITSRVGDYDVSQDYMVKFCRVPTLSGISLKDQDNVDLAATEPFTPAKTSYTVKVVDTVRSVKVFPVPMDPSYQVTVNNSPAETPVEIDGATTISVVVTGGEYSTKYTFAVEPGSGQIVWIKTITPGVAVEVTNSNGLVLPYVMSVEIDDTNLYQYTLVPGEEYSYIATYDTWFHATDTFTLDDAVSSYITVDVKSDHWLTDLDFSNRSAYKDKGTMELDTAFAAEDHSYTMDLEDTEANVYAWVDSIKDTEGKGPRVTAEYIQNSAYSYNHGLKKSVDLTPGIYEGARIGQLLLSENPYGNTLTIRLSQEINGVTYYQDYQVDLTRKLSLKSLEAFCGEEPVVLYRSNGEDTGYTPAERVYTLTVPMAADTLELDAEGYTPGSMNLCYGDESTGYHIYVDDVEVTEQKTVSVQMNGTLETQKIVVTVTNDKVPGNSSEYILTVKKAAPTVVTLNITPSEALLCVHERVSGNRIWPEEGKLLLSEGFVYDYTLTQNGYVGQAGTLQVTRNEENALVLLHNDVELPVKTEGTAGAAELELALVEAKTNEQIDSNIIAQWPNFRGNQDNNGVTNVPIPTAAEDGTLQWAIKLGEGIDSDAVGSPIIVDGDLITYAGSTLYRVDTLSGEILASGEMDHKSSFSITPPTYYEGMIFVALSNGSVQAFNAKTLESLWVYNDPLGGQPNSPITVSNGYLYTGFWNQEKVDANFVCLSVTDEDPTKPKEQKLARWYYTHTGGFYWAGAYACSDYVLVGTDDGRAGYSSQTSQLLLLDARTGKLLDRLENLNGDVRSTVSYDDVTRAFYFASKGGSFYSVKVKQTGDGWCFDGKREVALSNGSTGVPMSTSSPVVYNGRAYIGVSGAGQFSAYSGHNITVVDLERKAIAYSVPTKGYPQTSGLLTTAYEDTNGYVYVYFMDNYTPGKIRVLRDKAGQTEADYVTAEGNYSLAYDLFSPTGDHAQYAICSPIVDKYGTMYFKNDSGHLMAFGSMVKKLEISKMTSDTEYMEGEKFDPTGMEVTATLKNGMTRDVTEYVTWNTEPLTPEDSVVTIVYPHVLYHNAENKTSMTNGVSTTQPTTTVRITVTAAQAATEIRSLTSDDGEVVVTFDGTADQNWQIYVAAYSGGKMLKVEELENTGGVKLSASMAIPAGADQLKAFVLDTSGAPVMEQEEITFP